MRFDNTGLVNDGYCRPTDEAVEEVIDRLREQQEANTDQILSDYEREVDRLVEEAKHAA